MMNLRKGDKVSIIGTIKYDPKEDERVFVTVIGSHEDLWTKVSNVTLVQAKFEVGDRVGWDDCGKYSDGKGCEGEILAISGEHAWIEFNDGCYCTRHFGAIYRAPEKVDETLALANAHLDGYPVEPRTAAGSLD
jgi:hypothetical protein